MNTLSVVETIVQNHPDVFIVLLLRFNKNIEKLKMTYPNIFGKWPKGIDYNIPKMVKNQKLSHSSNDPIRNLLNSTRKNSYLDYSKEFKNTHYFKGFADTNDEERDKIIFDFIYSHIHCFNKKTFSLNANIKVDEAFIDSFIYSLIYWGINSDIFERDFLERYGNIGASTNLLNTHRKLKYERLKEGGISYNRNLRMNLKMLKRFAQHWDYFALLNNPSIDWDYHTFKFIKDKYIQKEDQIRYRYEREREDDELFYSSLIGLSLPNRDSVYKFWLEKFDTNPKFIAVDKVLQKKISNDEISDLLIDISNAPLEKHRLEYIYSYSSISSTFSEEYIINFSLELLNRHLDEWFSNANIQEIDSFINLLDFQKIEKVREILTEVHYLFRHIKGRSSFSDTDNFEIRNRDYCPACQESPCRCSDPDPN